MGLSALTLTFRCGGLDTSAVSRQWERQITAKSARAVPGLTKTAADVKMAQLEAAINLLGPTWSPVGLRVFFFLLFFFYISPAKSILLQHIKMCV